MSAPQGITNKQQAVITALISGQSAKSAALAGHVSCQTLWRWQSGDPAFVAELAKQKAAVVDGAARELAAVASTAVKMLAELAQNGEKEETRLKASGLILRLTFGRADLDELESRFALAHARILSSLAAGPAKSV